MNQSGRVRPERSCSRRDAGIWSPRSVTSTFGVSPSTRSASDLPFLAHVRHGWRHAEPHRRVPCSTVRALPLLPGYGARHCRPNQLGLLLQERLRRHPCRPAHRSRRVDVDAWFPVLRPRAHAARLRSEKEVTAGETSSYQGAWSREGNSNQAGSTFKT